MERVMGIEPTLVAWEATVLPLNYTRCVALKRILHQPRLKLPPGEDRTNHTGPPL